jgi:hypothetical protein
MNRRDAFGVIGAMGCGLGVGAAKADDHGHGKPPDAKLMAPVGNQSLHFCGIHCAKKDPRIQIITQHYCGMRGEPGSEMHQCLLYDSVGPNAKLLGVEYIITDDLYRTLPDAEKRYWHPHTYEVLAGGLTAPGMSPEDEHKFMSYILTTWGKTWHTWPDPNTPVPMGEPLLIWSLTGDGQADERVIAARDKEFKVSTAEIRQKRVQAFGLEVPQVSSPKSMDFIGRQWTDTGEDKPTKRK